MEFSKTHKGGKKVEKKWSRERNDKNFHSHKQSQTSEILGWFLRTIYIKDLRVAWSLWSFSALRDDSIALICLHNSSVSQLLCQEVAVLGAGPPHTTFLTARLGYIPSKQMASRKEEVLKYWGFRLTPRGSNVGFLTGRMSQAPNLETGLQNLRKL